MDIQYLLENIILNFPKTTGSHFPLAFEMLFILLLNLNLRHFLLATATLFLASNSEETPPRPKKEKKMEHGLL